MEKNTSLKELRKLAFLASCPFCDSDDLRLQNAQYQPSGRYLLCRKCGSRSGAYLKWEALFKAWNMRGGKEHNDDQTN